MNDPNCFRDNLISFRVNSRLSMPRFCEKLDIPRTTMNSIINGGLVTLDTACRVANSLKLPLCTMTGGVLDGAGEDVACAFMNIFSWYDKLSSDKRALVRRAIIDMFEALESDE